MKTDPTQPLDGARSWLEARRGTFPAEPLRGAVKLATGLVAGPPPTSLPLGASHFGGEPDLPPAAAWPRWREGPLSFLAQLDLATLPDPTGLLPERGTLLFFYDAKTLPWGFDPADEGGARVLYSEAEARVLTRTPFPEDLPPEARYAARTLEARPVVTLPTDGERAGLELEEDEDWERYAELESGITGLDPQHRVLGWPAELQNPMELECQLVSNGIYCGNSEGYRSEAAQQLAPGADEWILLCQLDSDEAQGWMWGDLGRLYFWIKRGHLRARRFDRVWTVLQCG